MKSEAEVPLPACQAGAQRPAAHTRGQMIPGATSEEAFATLLALTAKALRENRRNGPCPSERIMKTNSNDNLTIVTDDLFFHPVGKGYVIQGYLFERGTSRSRYWGIVPAGHWGWEVQRWRDEGGLGPIARGTAPTMAEAAASAIAVAEMRKAQRGAA